MPTLYFWHMKISDKANEIIENKAKARNLYIVDITYKQEGGKAVLRILADKEGGIQMEECASFNSELIEIFDKENTIEEEYVLEVSSPGLDRKLKNDKDFEWATGKNIKVTTYAPIEGENVFIGKLLGVSAESVVIEKDKIATEIQKTKIASARLNYEDKI